MRHMCCAVLLPALLLSGCSATPAAFSGGPGPTPSAEAAPSKQLAQSLEAVSFTDDLGRDVTIARPRRVAALTGSFADIWRLAGGRDTLAAAASDTWTNFDLGLEGTMVNLDSVKAPSLETLLVVEPDLILASCNTTADVKLLETFESAEIPAAYFEADNFEDYLRMLDIWTQLTGCPGNYRTYGTQV